MACFHPREGFRAKTVNESGKRSIVFSRTNAFTDLPVTVPCGQCTGCRLEHSRQWAIRMTHEASLYESNCFITLTYSDEYLPANHSLAVRPLQLFLKRLRKKYGKNVRFFACGEYGEQYFRPHFHLCLFNMDFPDKYPFKQSRDNILYRSPSLEKLWPYGHSSIGEMTFQSAAYCARYIMKKITGEVAEEYYEWIDQHGEIHTLKPEFTTQSRQPGLARGWLEQYLADVYPEDFIIMNGKKVKPPKAYDKYYELVQPDDLKKLKRSRKTGAKKHTANNTRDRLAVREKILQRKLDRLKRTDQ